MNAEIFKKRQEIEKERKRKPALERALAKQLLGYELTEEEKHAIACQKAKYILFD